MLGHFLMRLPAAALVCCEVMSNMRPVDCKFCKCEHVSLESSSKLRINEQVVSL